MNSNKERNRIVVFLVAGILVFAAITSVLLITPYFGRTQLSTSLPTVQGQVVRKLVLIIENKDIRVAKDHIFHAWTYNGTVPGPAIRVKQGETIEFTLINRGTTSHSIDFHAAQTPWNINYRSISPGESLTFQWVARYPGVFMYHCGTAPVLLHISNGMYGAIVVDPITPRAPAREFIVVSSEFYVDESTNEGSLKKAQNVQPDYVVFDGAANKYRDNPLRVNRNELVRMYVLNAGPTLFNAFHIIGTVFEKVEPDGNPANTLHGMQTYTVPPGGGVVVETTIPDVGLYPFVTHSFAYTGLGAVGLLNVTAAGLPLPVLPETYQ